MVYCGIQDRCIVRFVRSGLKETPVPSVMCHDNSVLDSQCQGTHRKHSNIAYGLMLEMLLKQRCSCQKKNHDFFIPRQLVAYTQWCSECAIKMKVWAHNLISLQLWSYKMFLMSMTVSFLMCHNRRNHTLDSQEIAQNVIHLSWYNTFMKGNCKNIFAGQIPISLSISMPMQGP